MAHRRHTEHRPTKEKFFAATYASGGDKSALGGFSGPDIDGTNEYGYTNCLIPWDFDKVVSIVLVFIATATQTPMYVNIVSDYAKAGEAYFEHNENVSLSINTVLSRIHELNLYDAVDTQGLEASDYLGIQASRLASLPTENTDMVILGVRLRYLYR